METTIDLLNLTASGDGYVPQEEEVDLSVFDNVDDNKSTELTSLDQLEQSVFSPIPLIDSLSQFVKTNYEEARRSKYEEGIDDRLLENMRQYEGVYNPNERQLINATGGSTNFRKLTMTKCDAADAWFLDILGSYQETPFRISPTPVPELAPDVSAKIVESTRMQMQEHIEKMIESGEVATESDMQLFMFEKLRNAIDEEQENTDAEARHKAEKMQRTIEDQLKEGKYEVEFEKFSHDFSIYINAFIKGPYVEYKKGLKWVQKNGKTVPIVEYKPIIVFKRVSPFDIYPSPEAESIQDADYIIERVKYGRQQLAELRKLNGYNAEMIDRVLLENNYVIQDARDWYIEYTRADLESKTYRVPQGAVRNYQTYEGWEYWGRVPGDKLRDWGLHEKSPGEAIDPNDTYDVTCVLIGNYVIKAQINADPLGKKPYSMDSFKKVPGSFWGISLPETMSDIQQTCNSSIRAIENNQSLSSGPQTMIDISQLPYGEDINNLYPYKIHQYDSSLNANSSTRPIDFFAVPNHAPQLLQVYDAFKREADDVTGIPAYAHGDSAVGGAGNTASGLAMLQGNATKNIKKIIMGIGNNIIIDIMSRLIGFNMLYNPDESIKGDLEVKCDGPLAVIAKQFAAQQGMQFLQMTNNPVDLQLTGEENRRQLLQEVAKTLSFPGKHVRTQEQLERAMIDTNNQAKQEQQQLLQQQQQLMEVEAEKLRQGQNKIDVDAQDNKNKNQFDYDELDVRSREHDDDQALALIGLEMEYNKDVEQRLSSESKSTSRSKTQ